MARTVLVVDDDESYLLAVSHLLRAAGYRALTGLSAAEARSQIEAETPDLILLDVLMPAEDGFTFAEELSKTQRLACFRVCPLGAIEIGEAMHADPVQCQACGLCASACPGSAIGLSSWSSADLERQWASGFGLGLAFVRELADRYGGHIELESAVGEATTVSVEFPLCGYTPPGSEAAQ